MNILHLTLKKKWFEMIATGKKLEEYRELKPYWHKRLQGRSYDAIKFRNGYHKDAPEMLIELKEILSGLGVVEWGAPEYERVYILKLGQILQAPNLGVGGKDFENRNQCQGCQAGWKLEEHKPWPKNSKKMYFHSVEGGYGGEKVLCTKNDYEI